MISLEGWSFTTKLYPLELVQEDYARPRRVAQDFFTQFLFFYFDIDIGTRMQ